MRFRLSPFLLLLALAPASQLRAADTTPADALKPFVEKNSLAGAVVLVASPDKVLNLEAVGFSDRANKTAMRTDDMFWIASMSKPITAAGLMMLVDEGKVKLDDPIEKYLPEFKGQMMIAEKDADHVLLHKPTRPPTVRDCLRHTSGMPFTSALETPTIDQWRLRDTVRSYAMTPLQYEPGTKHVYSNAGINTAGRIIEVVSGMPYEVFLEKRLFAPLGMKDTSFSLTTEQLKRLAKSYKPDKANTGLEETPIGALLQPLTDPSRQPVPGGGLFSTAADVAAFGQMILRGGTVGDKRLLSEAAIREMTGTQTGDILNKGKGEGGYGLGFSTTRKGKEGGPAVAGPCGHGGAYSTNLWVNPDQGLVTVFMVQHAGWPNDDGGKVRPAFEKAAIEMFGAKK
jgi:CubicO group peptidase (beta-lactamase class C family)